MNAALEGRWVVSSTPRPHFTFGKDPVPILQAAGWAPGPVWTAGKSRPHRHSIPDRPARSQSLYRLSYRGPPYSLLKYYFLIYLSKRLCTKNMKLSKNTQLHLVPRLRMSGAITSLPQYAFGTCMGTTSLMRYSTHPCVISQWLEIWFRLCLQ